jgi:uncharacterized protein
MDRTVMWMQWNNLGMEQLHLENNTAGLATDSVVLGIRDGNPFRAHYQIEVNQNWRVQHLQVKLLQPEGKTLSLKSDGEGHWWHYDGAALPELTGCVDIDLSATPFTNTLAIRRLALQPGEVQEISVIYVSVPDLEVRAVPQRYTCLELNSQGGIYRYEGLYRNFMVELLVDRNGLVIEYPQMFRRIWSIEEPR